MRRRFPGYISRALEIENETAAVEARRIIRAIGAAGKLAEETIERAVLVSSEAISNVVKYAESGVLVAGKVHDGRGVRLTISDYGPGITDLRKALKDGHSTGGSSGTGLGAIERLSDLFEVYSDERGTTILSEVREGPKEPLICEIGCVAVPKPGEEVCGDGWSVICEETTVRLLVTDGLGHGLLANKASARAVDAFLGSEESAPADLIRKLDVALRGTRGAAGLVAEIDDGREEIRFAGVGNVRGVIIDLDESKELISYNGTIGAQPRTIRELQSSFAREDVLIVHSDGIRSRFSPRDYPGLMTRHPALIASVIYRDWNRGTDDATVIALRRTRA